MPKSSTLATTVACCSGRRMFSGLRSRCSTPHPVRGLDGLGDSSQAAASPHLAGSQPLPSPATASRARARTPSRETRRRPATSRSRTPTRCPAAAAARTSCASRRNCAPRIRAGQQVVAHHLDRYVAIEPHVVRQVDCAHAAGAGQPIDAYFASTVRGTAPTRNPIDRSDRHACLSPGRRGVVGHSKRPEAPRRPSPVRADVARSAAIVSALSAVAPRREPAADLRAKSTPPATGDPRPGTALPDRF